MGLNSRAFTVDGKTYTAGIENGEVTEIILIDGGVDVITLGNHAWDQKEMLSYIEECPKIIRALNYPSGVPGKGYYELTLPNDNKIVIIQIMLRLFMGLSLDDPFSVTKIFLQREKLGATCNAILIDMHGEATSEKNAFGHYFDGKVSAIVGTHTHVPTSDARILDAGTAYQTDVGMTGDYNSVIGMNAQNSINRFLKKESIKHFPAKGGGTICGIIVEANPSTGLAEQAKSFIYGGELKNSN